MLFRVLPVFPPPIHSLQFDSLISTARELLPDPLDRRALGHINRGPVPWPDPIGFDAARRQLRRLATVHLERRVKFQWQLFIRGDEDVAGLRVRSSVLDHRRNRSFGRIAKLSHQVHDRHAILDRTVANINKTRGPRNCRRHVMRERERRARADQGDHDECGDIRHLLVVRVVPAHLAAGAPNLDRVLDKVTAT